MINLPSISTIKKAVSIKTGLLLLLAVTIIIVILVIQRTPRKEVQPPGTNPIFGKLPAPKPTYVSQAKPPQSSTFSPQDQLNLTQTTTVYRRTPSTVTEEQSREVAQSFGIVTDPQVLKNTIMFRENNKTLIINLKKGSLSYFEPLPAYLKSLKQTALEEYALILVKQLYPNDPFWIEPKLRTGFFTIQAQQSFSPAPATSAQLAIVDIFPQINNIKIVGPYEPFGQTGMVSVQFNTQDNTLVLNGLPTSLNTSEVGTYPLKTLETVQQELQTKGALLTATVPGGQTFKSIDPGQNLDPTTANFTDIELVYYYDPDPNAFLQPMYLFSGKTTLTDGRPADIYAILPAIDPQYLKP